MRTKRITINRTNVWLTFDNLRVETDNGIEEIEDKFICFYKLTEPTDLIYGEQIIDSNDERLIYDSIEQATGEVTSFLLDRVYPPNFEHPLNYKKENLPEIMNKRLVFDVGSHNSDEIKETIVGSITNCTLASNPPYLPGTARITLIDGTQKSFNFFQIKRIRRE